MSAEINNREYRKQKLKEIIQKLHQGHTVDQVKEAFEATFGQVSAEEISQAEQALINEGMAVEEVQRLCDVHAEVFKGAITDIHKPKDQLPGHPIHTLKASNQALRQLIAEIRGLMGKQDGASWKPCGKRRCSYQALTATTKSRKTCCFPIWRSMASQRPPR